MEDKEGPFNRAGGHRDDPLPPIKDYGEWAATLQPYPKHPGVFFNGKIPGGALKKELGLLLGYLYIESQPLRTMCHQGSLSVALANYLAGKKSRYWGCGTMGNAWKLWTVLLDPACTLDLLHRIGNDPAAIALDSLPKAYGDKGNRLFLYIAAICLNMLETEPALFTGWHPVRKMIHGYATEAWWRAFQLAVFFAEGRLPEMKSTTSKSTARVVRPEWHAAPLGDEEYRGFRPLDHKADARLVIAEKAAYADWLPALDPRQVQVSWSKAGEVDVLLGRDEKKSMSVRISSTGRPPMTEDDYRQLVSWLERKTLVLERGIPDHLTSNPSAPTPSAASAPTGDDKVIPPILSTAEQQVPSTEAPAASNLATPPIVPNAEQQATIQQRLAATFQPTDDIDAQGAAATVGDPDAADTAIQSTVRQLNQSLRQISAPLPSFESACEILELDAAHPVVFGGTEFAIELKVYQVTALAFGILEEEVNQIPLRMLADDCGLGKTLTLLMLAYFAARRGMKRVADAKAAKQIVKETFLPTMIVAPASVVPVWTQEIRARFPVDTFTLHMFYDRSSSIGDLSTKAGYLRSVEELHGLLDQMDPSDPANLHKIILTSYDTLPSRALKLDEARRRTRLAGRPSGSSSRKQVEDNRIEDFDLLLPSKSIGRMILDEATYVRSRFSQRCIALQMLEPQFVWSVSATPILNNPLDILGPLAILQQQVPDLINDDYRLDELNVYHEYIEAYKQHVTDYDSYAHFINGGSLLEWPLETLQAGSAAATGRRLSASLLCPDRILQFAEHNTLSQGMAGPILRVILGMICVRRHMLDEIVGYQGKPYVIGGEIPPIRVSTVELGWNLHEKVLFKKYYKWLLKERGRGQSDGPTAGEQTSLVDFGVHRALCLTSFDPTMLLFGSRLVAHLGLERTTDEDRREWAEEHGVPIAETDSLMKEQHRQALNELKDSFVRSGDHGATGIWDVMHEECPWQEAPTSRLDMIKFLCDHSPKLRYVLLRVLKLVRVRGERVVIFNNWPLVQHILEATLALANITTDAIRSNHSLPQREEATREWCDGRSSCQVLVTSMAVGGFGLNLHTACSHMLVVDLPANMRTLQQAMYRLYRTGQTKEAHIEIVNVDESFDYFLQHAIARKAVPQLMGETELSIDSYRPNLDGTAIGPTEEQQLAWACEDEIRKTLGQATSRLWWDNPRSFTKFSHRYGRADERALEANRERRAAIEKQKAAVRASGRYMVEKSAPATVYHGLIDAATKTVDPARRKQPLSTKMVEAEDLAEDEPEGAFDSTWDRLLRQGMDWESDNDSEAAGGVAKGGGQSETPSAPRAVRKDLNVGEDDVSPFKRRASDRLAKRKRDAADS